LSKPCHVKVTICNLHGKVLRILDDSKKFTGFNKTVWDGKDESGQTVSQGIYFYRIETSSGQIQSKRMVFLR
jgi:flagellar hook assembly protein FlgD